MYIISVAGLQIVPLIGCVAASRSVAKVRNVPWLPLLSRALDGGTQLGTAAAWSYFVTKELTNREHCAITLTGISDTLTLSRRCIYILCMLTMISP